MPAATAAPILCVRDLLASCELYERAFRFRRLRYFDGNGEHAYGAGRSADAPAPAGGCSSAPHPGSHVADSFVWVDDLTPIFKSAQSAGLTSNRGPEHYTAAGGHDQGRPPDLDENWICVTQAGEP